MLETRNKLQRFYCKICTKFAELVIFMSLYVHKMVKIWRVSPKLKQFCSFGGKKGKIQNAELYKICNINDILSLHVHVKFGEYPQI